MKDHRFTIDREHCGYPRQRWVLRFCGDFIASFQNQKQARQAKMGAVLEHRRKIQEASFK